MLVDSFTLRLSVLADSPAHPKNLVHEAVRVEDISITINDLWNIYHYESPGGVEKLSVVMFHSNPHRRLWEVHFRKGLVGPETHRNG